jgi:hypothetical protein
MSPARHLNGEITFMTIMIVNKGGSWRGTLSNFVRRRKEPRENMFCCSYVQVVHRAWLEAWSHKVTGNPLLCTQPHAASEMNCICPKVNRCSAVLCDLPWNGVRASLNTQVPVSTSVYISLVLVAGSFTATLQSSLLTRLFLICLAPHTRGFDSVITGRTLFFQYSLLIRISTFKCQ